MLRTTLGLSFILVLGGLAACSSKATDNDNTSGGNGTIVGGSGNSGGNAAGTSATAAGTTSTSGGMTSTAGTTNTAGTSPGACTAGTVTCTDATHAQICNTTTGALETISCIDPEYATLGFDSTGCSADETGEGCDLTFKDAACEKGMPAYAFCAGASTNEQFLNIYINCFQDYMGAHTIIPCFADYVSETMTTDADCMKAEDACFGAGGAGPDGAGGAP